MTVLADAVATRRLLDRLGLGPRPGELAAAVGQGFAATLDRLLAAPVDPGPPAPTLAPITDRGTPGSPERAAAQQQRGQGQDALTRWWLDRMWATTSPLPERLTWFWHGHFATSAQKVNQPAFLLTQNETLRRLGTGDFRTLAQAMVVDPAMLVWLDGRTNRVGAPNENLAREFMELFALGVGHYTEPDVREAARALTGWTVDTDAGTARLVPRRQDTGPKTILGRTAAFDAPSFVDLVVARPESAAFVAGRMWSRLVSTTPPPPQVLGTLTDAYGPGRDLRALLRAIATSAPFHDAGTTLVKQPVEWAVGLMRAVGAQPSAVTTPPRGRRRGQGDPVHQHLEALGQVPFRPPSVGGWPAGTAWLTPSAQLDRMALAQAVVARATVPPGPTGANAQLDWARQTLGVDAFGPRSTDALRDVAGGDPRTVLAVAALTPEYVISA
ncbi:DUF1800 domain-containing protein [Actinomycetospora sp. NBRC 106378]|uniref:DUF1800 domain-containing protein n=1 Tax=Actinomycetospora sp. NBRC 106378 TaxID=3032208 RepID=UPI0024A24FDF|nr:DUF1800 domain-containing protein [Actinomycetospora sp. NBRC 106378]GLZ50505.1 hypothetical protein Acsp07_01220 [Actinomycetospora sp. NBRC 106378]